jgi:ketosteroid isomerase-like protein
MKRLFTLLCVLACALPLCAQRKSAGVADQLKKLEQQRTQAVIKGDTTTLDRMTGNDYFFIDAQGRVRKKQDTLSAIKSGDIKIESNDLDDLDVHVYGNTAVLTGKSTVKGQTGGQDSSGTYRFLRVYVKQGGGQWKSVAFQQTKVPQ